MMSTRSNVKNYLIPAKRRRDHGNIGQMCATILGMIRHEHVAGFQLPLPYLGLLPYTRRHAAQMHRQMRRIRNQAPLCVKQRARVIEPFLDVGTDAGLLQGAAHLLGNGHEAVRKDA